ncbi:MAG TPA: GNAT family N-acetyltransferase [Thermoanaerobaculia bacterium]
MRILDLVIRDATADDAKLLAQVGAMTIIQTFAYRTRLEVIERLSARIFNEEAQRREIEANDHKTLVAVWRDDVLGMIRLRLHKDKTYEIVRFGVLQAFQRQGVGRKLMEAMTTVTGASLVTVRIPQGVSGAARFFEKYEFRMERERAASKSKRHDLILTRGPAASLHAIAAATPGLRPRIFVSYSTHRESEKVLARVVRMLRDNDFDVWVDRERMKLGEQFPRQIFTEIFQCHGGVVIFSEPAAESQWVQAEATVLAARAWRDGDKFPVTLIFVPPEKPETILRRKPFEALDLASMHAIKNPDSDRELRLMVERFEPLKRSMEKTPVDELIDVVVRRLPRDQPLLARAAYAALDQSTLQFPETDVALADASLSAPLLARSFFHIGLHAFRDALRLLASAMSRSEVSTVVDLVVPFWIDPKAVAPLARAAFGRGRSVPMINARNDMTVKMYIKRAAAEYPFRWVVIPVTAAGGEKTLGAIISEIRRGFRDADPALISFDKDEIDEQITLSLDPVIVVLPPTVRVETIKQIRAKYPSCTYFIRTGPSVPPREQYVGLDVVLLEPELTPAVEAEIHALYIACNRIAESIV